MAGAVSTEFINWVTSTPLSMLIQTRLWMIPAIQSIHIVAVALVFSAVALLDLKLLGVYGRDQSLVSMTRRFLPATWITLVVLAITGALLIIAEPARSLFALPFLLKMAMLAAVIVITVIFQRVVATNASRWEASPTQSAAARVTAVVSLALWIGIIVAGRWIAYAEV